MNAAIFQSIFQNVPEDVRVFLVGGAVRDEFEAPDGFESCNDFDFAVEGCRDFQALVELVHSLGFRGFSSNRDQSAHGFLVHPEQFSLRCRGPVGSFLEREQVDFVCCRRESREHSDGRRPDSVEVGSQFEDASRRDFSVNSLAFDVVSGEVVDHFNGVQDLEDRVLRAVGSAVDRFLENPVRVVRAFRFWLVRGFQPDAELQAAFRNPEVVAAVAAEDGNLVREQLNRVLSEASPSAVFAAFAQFPEVSEAFFANGVNLVASQASRRR